MPRLLQINVTYKYGSTGRIADSIGDLAISHGWESWIAYGRELSSAKGSKSHIIRIGNETDIYLHGLQSRIFDRHGLASKKATSRLIETIKDINPDIIHLHNIHGYYLNYPILFEFLSATNTPVIWTLHDCWPFTGHCAYFTFNKCEKWKSLCAGCTNLKAYPTSLLFDNSANNHKLKRQAFTSVGDRLLLVPVSNWLNDIAHQSFLKDCRSAVIHNGIDPEIFHPHDARQQTDDSRQMILGVANVWEPRKGLTDLIKLDSMIDHTRFRITIVGLSADQLKKLPPSIIGIQRTQDIHALARLYAETTVYVNPTYEDNFPTTNLEALACGTPVVTYNTGGSPEAVDPSTGAVITPGDLPGLLKAIEHFADTPDKESLSKACRHRAVTMFDRRECYQKYFDLYMSLLK